DHENGSGLPALGEGERRDSQQVDGIADEGEEPDPAALVADVSGAEPERVAEELAHAGDDSNQRGARAQASEERAVDASPAFVRDVGEEVDDAHRQYERERRRQGGLDML